MPQFVRHLGSIAPFGMAVVLTLLVMVGLGSMVVTQQVTTQVTATLRRNDVLEQTRYLIDNEFALQRQYYVQPQGVRQRFATQTVAVAGTLRAAERGATAVDQTTFARLLTQQARFVTAATWFFAIMDRGNLAVAVQIDNLEVAPLFGTMQQIIDRASDATNVQLASRVRTLTNSEQAAHTATLITYVPGLLLVIIFGLLLRAYRRWIDAITRSQMELLQANALTDHLTGLGNLRAFVEESRRAQSHSERHSETLALSLVDVDDFKHINDQHGHSHGDAVLTALGELLRSGRAENSAFHLGGDEFAVLLPVCTAYGAVVAMERLRHAVETKIPGATISVGVAALEPGKGEITTLREAADAALYEAKRRGRNTVVSFEEIQYDAAIVSTAKILSVRRLIAEQNVTVVFQPIWDLAQSTILGYEALIRPGTDYGLDGPQEAFDIAERIGHASELDAVCRAAILARASELPAGALLFINVSPQSLDHALLAGDSLVRAVTAAGLVPRQVVLEITEQSLVQPAIVSRESQRFRDLGFRIALDDVGSGHTGLDMLRALSMDYLKIDRSIVAGAINETAARSVLAAILAFARTAEIPVIAEGIETEHILAFIEQASRNGSSRQILAAQGYLIGRPSPTFGKIEPRIPGLYQESA